MVFVSVSNRRIFNDNGRLAAVGLCLRSTPFADFLWVDSEYFVTSFLTQPQAYCYVPHMIYSEFTTSRSDGLFPTYLILRRTPGSQASSIRAGFRALYGPQGARWAGVLPMSFLSTKQGRRHIFTHPGADGTELYFSHDG